MIRSNSNAVVTDTTTSCLCIGLLIANLSPVVVAIAPRELRLGILAIGTGLLAIPVLKYFAARDGGMRGTGTFYRIASVIVVLAIMELLNLLNTDSELAISLVPLRMVTYFYALVGACMATTQRKAEPNSSLGLQLVAALISIFAAAIWLRYASVEGMDRSRFAGSEELSAVGLGFCFGIASATCIGLAAYSRSVVGCIGLIIATMALCMCILKTGSRGAFLALAVVAVCAMFLRISTTAHLLRAIAGLVLITAAMISAVIFVPGVSDQMEFLIERFSMAADSGSDMSLVERQELRSYYLQRASQWLLLGDRTFGVESYPHNLFLELVIRFGLPLGCMLAAAVIYAAFRMGSWLYSDERKAPDLATYIISLLGVFTIIICQFNLSLEVNRPLFLAVSFWTTRKLNR